MSNIARWALEAFDLAGGFGLYSICNFLKAKINFTIQP
jgi:hypothetical protein